MTKKVKLLMWFGLGVAKGANNLFDRIEFCTQSLPSFFPLNYSITLDSSYLGGQFVQILIQFLLFEEMNQRPFLSFLLKGLNCKCCVCLSGGQSLLTCKSVSVHISALKVDN